MKRHLLFVLLLINYALYAQSTTTTHRTQFGIRAGASFSVKYGSALFHMPEYTRIGLTPSVFLRFPLSNHLALIPELSYVKQGFRVGEIPIYSDCITFNLVSTIRLGITKSNLSIGPYVSYLVDKSVYTPQEKALEVGGLIGIGFDLSKHLSLDCRYHTSGQVWEFDYGLLRNTFLDLSLGFYF